jgi:hypothetical protein
VTFEDWKESVSRIPLGGYELKDDILSYIGKFDARIVIKEIMIIGPEQSWIGIQEKPDGSDCYIIVAGRAIGMTDDMDHAFEVMWEEHARYELQIMRDKGELD